MEQAFPRVSGTLGARRCAKAEAAKVHEAISKAGGLWAFVGRAAGVFARRREPAVEAAVFQPEPERVSDPGDFGVLRDEGRSRVDDLGGVQLGRDADGMKARQFGGNQFGRIGSGSGSGSGIGSGSVRIGGGERTDEGFEAPLPLDAASVVLAMGGEVGLAEGHAGAGDMTRHELGIGLRELGAGEAFGGEKKTCAALHEPTGGLVDRDAGGIAVMVATLEQVVVADNPAVTVDEVVIVDRDRTAAETRQLEDLEDDVEACLWGELPGKGFERAPESVSSAGTAPVNEDPDLEFPVGRVVGQVGSAEHGAFAASVSAADEDGVEAARGDHGAEAEMDLVTDISEVGLERVATVESETGGRSGNHGVGMGGGVGEAG